ncbi:MAG: tRNA uridine-5-carboxymethylaminomethyl(34) synthesis GTPase MnmE [Spirochaetaceae bacterium]|jgi:tRNA modification GTPase|nr:tRNA uridine-5-carboxymethylaminomethyl(34) synthesis GTPase MnmE [Spirochaetaceae bacterium]
MTNLFGVQDGGFYGDEGPIAACATALAESALALVRVSGRGCVDLISGCFSRPEALRGAAGNSVVYGWIVDGGRRIDEVLINVYRAPKSYTGEDGMDISCHGGLAAGRAVLQTLYKHGFRPALRGEFSFRSFLNGKIDLTRAEAVLEMVSAKSDKGLGRAVSRLSGVLEQEIRQINKLFLDSLTEIELLLDYSELDGVSADDEALPGRAAVEAALSRLLRLERSYRAEKLYRDGALAVIAGKPNAGKSSLFNLLLREERSIISEIPGTTRDWIEGWISIEGIPVRLADTAGLRESEDALERLGMERSFGLLDEADLVILVLDGASGGDEVMAAAEDFMKARKGASVLPVWNKADLAPPPHGVEHFCAANFCAANFCAANFCAANFCAISAKTGDGLNLLYERIARILEKTAGTAAPDPAGPALGSGRQKTLIDTAISCAENALAMHDEGLPADLIAPSLREAVNCLGEITGEVSSHDILESMFNRFCVGK